eukprot:g1291.t1
MRRQAYYEDVSDAAQAFAPGIRILREAAWRNKKKRKKVRHHFGWEDQAAVEQVLSSDWRARYNGSQFYLDENDGYDGDILYGKRGGQKARRRRTRYEENDDLKAYDGKNIYDDGWEYCAVDEETLQESSRGGVLTQDNILIERNREIRHHSHAVVAKPVTHVLALTTTPDHEDKYGNVVKKGSTFFNWREVRGEEDRLGEVMGFLRDLLVQKMHADIDGDGEDDNLGMQSRRLFALHLRKCDRYGTGLLPRARFEDCLNRFGLLELLNLAEVDLICDAFASNKSASGDDIQYNSFLRHLLKKKRRRRSKHLGDSSENSENMHEGKSVGHSGEVQAGSTMIAGSWRGVPFSSRFVVQSNTAPVHGDEGFSDNISWPKRKEKWT